MSLSMSELIAAENAQSSGENSFASSNFVGRSDATTTPTKQNIFCAREAAAEEAADAAFAARTAATCLLYTSPSPRDGLLSRMPSSA